MDPTDDLLARILRAVDRRAYHTPTGAAPPSHRAALDEIGRMMQDASQTPEAIEARIDALHAAGRIDDVSRLSALGVLAASPAVADYGRALALAGEQELAAHRRGGPHKEDALASVDRHRGVAFFLAGQPEAAVDHFTRAFERQHTAENLGNVLAALLRLGDLDEADAILGKIKRVSPPTFVLELEHAIDTDPDLAPLRAPEAS